MRRANISALSSFWSISSLASTSAPYCRPQVQERNSNNKHGLRMGVNGCHCDPRFDEAGEQLPEYRSATQTGVVVPVGASIEVLRSHLSLTPVRLRSDSKISVKRLSVASA